MVTFYLKRKTINKTLVSEISRYLKNGAGLAFPTTNSPPRPLKKKINKQTNGSSFFTEVQLDEVVIFEYPTRAEILGESGCRSVKDRKSNVDTKHPYDQVNNSF